MRKWTTLRINTLNDNHHDQIIAQKEYEKLQPKLLPEEGDNLINMNTIRSKSMSSFNTPLNQNEATSTLDLATLNRTKSNSRSKRLEKTYEFVAHGVQSDVLSSIKPKKSRNRKFEIENTFSEREIEEIMNGMQYQASKSTNSKNSYMKLKKKSAQEELNELRVEYKNCLSQCEIIAQDNQNLAQHLKFANQEIIALKRSQKSQISEDSFASRIEHLQREEIKQAKEYIEELEKVLAKSKSNIIYLKDLIVEKDDKNRTLQKEVAFYRELSERHIAESSRLGKDIISIRSQYNKLLNKSSQIKKLTNPKLGRTQSVFSMPGASDSIPNHENQEIRSFKHIKGKPKTSLTSSKENEEACIVAPKINLSLKENPVMQKYVSGKTKMLHPTKPKSPPQSLLKPLQNTPTFP
ncbi:unnamed protein product [Moneuplotes crassus]|uniref:Uncharacterized protein n=1 Tax=Euplotes crassus TaxID=5936 RepID=A0AAD1ULE3_EUPCR|nr:unnamed protein product [Moneuplotes crassus]